MSLRVWLPLNGDLHNQGLSNVTVTNNGATINTSGKIGSCYYFNGSAQYLQFSDSLGNIYSNDFSWTVWLKPTDDTRGIIISEYSSAGASNVAFELLANRVIRVYWNGSPDWSFSAIPKDVWSHVAITKHVNTIKVYINGVESGSKTTTLSARPSTAKIRIGDDYRGGTNVSYMGYMNDVRIYDHALSAKEVKEIAKGLVLHYKLDDRFCEPTTNLCSTSTGGWNNSGTCIRNTNDISIANKPTPGATYSVTATSDGSMAVTLGTTSSNLSSKTIVASVYCWLDGIQTTQPVYVRSTKTDGSVGNLLYNGNANPTAWPSRQWIRLESTPIATASDATTFYLCTYITKNTEVRAFNGWQIEEKNHVTPWATPGTNRALTTIYDSSGYGNDGTIIGNLTIDSNSPRYGVSTNLTTTSSHIATTTLTTAGFTNSYSISWWGNVSTYSGRMMWGFTNGNRLNGIYNGNLWNTGDGANNPLYQPGTTTQVSAPTANIWHHFVMVGDGTTCKVYKDGELWGQAKTYKSLTGTIIYFNGWANATNYTLENTKLSDFRIYATALTPEQIKELYNTSMSIDNNGNIHARELVEL